MRCAAAARSAAASAAPANGSAAAATAAAAAPAGGCPAGGTCAALTISLNICNHREEKQGTLDLATRVQRRDEGRSTLVCCHKNRGCRSNRQAPARPSGPPKCRCCQPRQDGEPRCQAPA